MHILIQALLNSIEDLQVYNILEENFSKIDPERLRIFAADIMSGEKILMVNDELKRGEQAWYLTWYGTDSLHAFEKTSGISTDYIKEGGFASGFILKKAKPINKEPIFLNE